jgi:tetratricopeptide (TPR) repeat protein
MVLLAQGKTEESIACLASVKEENSCVKLYWRGMLYINLFDQNFEEAELNYKMLLEAGGVPDVRDSIFIGSVYAYSGKVEESTAIYKRLDESYPINSAIDNPPHVNLGFMVYSLARNDKNMAMKYLRILDSRGFIMGINYLIEKNPLFTELREESECQEILLNAQEAKTKERAIIQEMADRGEISL